MIRVLHIIGPMNRGGAERGLLHALSRLKGSGIEFHFTAFPERRGLMDDLVRKAGGILVPLPLWTQPFRYVNALKRLLRREAYDVVHAHHPEFAGYMLKYAKDAHVGARFLHARNTYWDTTERGSRGFLYKIYGKKRTLKSTTRGIAISAPAAESVFGADWKSDPRFTVIHNGIDLEPFENDNDVGAVRQELGISENDTVIGHVGRFDSQKNHELIVDTCARLLRDGVGVRLLLVGDGPLRGEIERMVGAKGLAETVIIAGMRSDVPRMLAAMDTFLFPSLHEGLGLAFIEAQAASVPCVISEHVPREAIVRSDAVAVLDLRSPLEKWADACIRMAARRRPDDRTGLEALKKTDFNADVSTARLVEEYRRAVEGGGDSR